MMAGRKTKHGSHLRLIVIRRIVQLFFLAVFLFLFIKTDYNGSDRLEAAVNILFRLDPFLAAGVMLAAKTVVVLFLPALMVVVLTFFSAGYFAAGSARWVLCLISVRKLFRQPGEKIVRIFLICPCYFFFLPLLHRHSGLPLPAMSIRFRFWCADWPRRFTLSSTI